MTKYDPAHLRNAATYLESQDMPNAATALRTKADAIQKQNLEDQINFNIGSNFRNLIRERNGWTFNAVSDDDIRGFGKAARDAVAKYCPKSANSTPVGGSGNSPYTARSGW